MEKKVFRDYDDRKGVGDLLFVNLNHPTQYRFYRRRKNWDECYMVEFCSNLDDYLLYCGHNEQDRGMIDATAILLPPYSKVEWKRIEFEPLLAYNLPNIIEEVKKRISIYNMGMDEKR